jgi:hypothetical protein
MRGGFVEEGRIERPRRDLQSRALPTELSLQSEVFPSRHYLRPTADRQRTFFLIFRCAIAVCRAILVGFQGHRPGECTEGLRLP